MITNNQNLFPILISFLGTLVFIFLCYDFATSINLVDNPSWRKNHKGKIPLIGGLAVIYGFSLGCLLSPFGLSEWRIFFVSVTPLVIIGVMDDHGDVSVVSRIITQVFACAIMYYFGNIKLINYGDIFGAGFSFAISGLEFPLMLLLVVGVINAINLIDGIDGLSSSLSLVTCFSILIISSFTGQNSSTQFIIYFSTALFAFLIVNLGLTKNFIKKVFLGDTGTTLIGFFLCWHLIKMSNGENQIFRPITALWILAIPILDTLSVIIRRLNRKKSPFSASRDHIHHLLMDSGFSQLKVVIILVCIAILISAVGIYSEFIKAPEFIMFYGMILLFSIYHYSLEILQQRIEIKSKH